MAFFPKPAFSTLRGHYKTDSDTVHSCNVIDPTIDTVNTCAARMSEALVLANGIVKTRGAMALLGTSRGNGQAFLLGSYGYGTTANTGKLCPHGIARGAQDLGAFLRHHWGSRSKGWGAQTDHATAPSNIKGLTGLVVYMQIPGFGGQGHIDLWDNDAPVGSQYWASETIWFWELG